MSVFDNRLRRIHEFIPATVAAIVALSLSFFPWAFFPVMPQLGWIVALILGGWATWRFFQGAAVIRYQAQLRRLPR